MDNNNYCNRRRVLQLSASAGSGILSAGAVAAKTSKADDEDGTSSLSNRLSVENGRVVPDAYHSKSSGSGISLRDVAHSINIGIQNGYWEPIEKGRKIFVEVTEAGRRKISQLLSKHGLQSSSMQNRNTWDCDGVSKETGDAVWFNDGDTGEVSDAIRSVAGVTALAGVIAGAVLSAPIVIIPAVIFAVAAFLLNDFAGDLLRINDGCGVKVKEYNFIGWDVRPQDCDC